MTVRRKPAQSPTPSGRQTGFTYRFDVASQAIAGGAQDIHVQLIVLLSESGTVSISNGRPLDGASSCVDPFAATAFAWTGSRYGRQCLLAEVAYTAVSRAAIMAQRTLPELWRGVGARHRLDPSHPHTLTMHHGYTCRLIWLGLDPFS